MAESEYPVPNTPYTREAAWQLVCEYTESPSLRKHALSVETCVRTYGERQADALGTEAVHPVRNLTGLLDRRTADDCARDTMHKQIVDGGAIAQPAADLQADRALGGELVDQVAIAQCAVTGGVEIHHVQPRCAGIGETPGQGHRVAVRGLTVEVALGQTDRPAAADVDRGVEVHHVPTGVRPSPSTAPTKLARMCSPTAPDFSGWNWVPQTWPRSAEAVTAPP